MVDAVVREWLNNLLHTEAAVEGIGKEVRLLLACFYTDDGLIACCDPDLLQCAFNELTKLFERCGLKTNVKKTEAVTFAPGKICVCDAEDGYRARMDAEFRKNRGSRMVQCNLCSAELAAGSLQSHLETQYDTFHSFTLGGCKEKEERNAVVFTALWDVLVPVPC